MDLTVTFLIEISVIVVLLGVLAAGVLISYRRRRQNPTEPPPADTGAREPERRREFFKSTGPGRNEEAKLRLYSPEEYAEELGGDANSDNMVAALKVYRQLEDTWHELSPGQAAEALKLSPEDYEVDGEHGVLLLRKMPPGLPPSASDF